MGDANNITEATLEHLSEHWGKSLADTKLALLQMLETQDKALEEDQHLKQMFEKAANAWGQSIDQAKKNTQALLKKD